MFWKAYPWEIEMKSFKTGEVFQSVSRVTSVMFMAAVILLAVGVSDVKASIGKGTLTADNVNVRADAGATAARVVSLPRGTEMSVDGVKADAAGKYWYQVSFTYNNKSYSGYILGDYVKYTASKTEQTAKSKQKAKTEQQTDFPEADVTEIAVPEAIANDPVPEPKAEQTSEETAAKKTVRKGTIQGDQVRVRKKPVTGAEVIRLMKGEVATVTSEKKGSDGYTWYKIKIKKDGKTKKGYVRSDFIQVTEKEVTVKKEEETAVVLSDQEFEDAMKQQGFPEDYKPALRALHEKHPTWSFKATNTGLDWSQVLQAESKVGRNLVSKNAITSWKSTELAAYNWRNNTWYTFDGGSWVAASSELTAYYMDPRNFLDETQIYQFESLEYQDYQTKEGVQAMLAGTFMKGKYKDTDGKKKSYAQTFLDVGKEVGVNPYHLAARCYQEQGTGKSDSICGAVVGYENIFNYFNVGAYASGKNSPSRQGLVYAASSTAGANNYGRPWNSRYQSILGGSMYLAEKYIKVGQNTLYFQKFNVVNTKNGLYQHQYMTNVQAAYSEAVKMKKAYEAEDAALVFYIPVYGNMPAEKCALPSSNENANNYLSDLSVEDQKIKPTFNGGVFSYQMTVKKKVETVTINATAAAESSTVSGTGEVALERGDNTFVITCRSASGKERQYTLKIKRK